VVGEFLDRNRLPPGEGVIPSNRQNAWLAGEARADHKVGLFQRHPRGHGVDVVLVQSAERVLPRHLHDLDAALGVKGLEGPDDLDEVRAAGGPAQEAEPQCSLESVRRDVRLLEHTVKPLYRGTDVAQEPVSERRQFDTATGAVNERATELVLERAEALANARGRELEPLGRASEVQLLGKREKQP
jgi:hypothetical protein